MCSTDKISIPEALKRIYENNRAYCEHTSDDVFEAVQEFQKPWVALVTCADSRVPIDAVVGKNAPLGQAFKYTCAGGIPDGGRGSLEFAVDQLGTKLIVVKGHTECGMVIAAVDGVENPRESLQQDIALVRERIAAAPKDDSLQKLDNLTQKIVANMFAQAAVIREWFKEDIAKGELIVATSLFDLHNKIGGGYGRQYAYDINGETDLEKLLAHPVLAGMDEKMRADFLLKSHLK